MKPARTMGCVPIDYNERSSWSPQKRASARAVISGLVVCIMGVLVGAAHAQASVVADRDALEALYHSAGGSDWTNRTNWLSAAPLGDWFGIVTDENGRVTGLELRGNRLIGPIPPSWASWRTLSDCLSEATS